MKRLLLKGIICSMAIFAATASHAGSTNAIFECKSASGRTVLTASVPGDHAEHFVELTIDGETIVWKDVTLQQAPFNNDKNSSIHVLGNLNKKNYHFLITASGSGTNNSVEVFRFSAVPSSINLKQTSGGERGNLSAVIIGKDPRAEKKGQASPEIVVNCSYTYEI